MGDLLVAVLDWLRATWRSGVTAWGKNSADRFTWELLRDSGLSPSLATPGEPSPFDESKVAPRYEDAEAAVAAHAKLLLAVLVHLVVAATLILWALVVTVRFVFRSWPRTTGELPHRLSGLWSSFTDLLFDLSPGGQVVSAIGALIAVRMAVYLWSFARGIDQRSRQISTQFEEAARPLVITEINRLVNQEAPTRLWVRRAPTLGDVQRPEQLAPRVELLRFRHLEEELGARVIGIRGPRGVGKTSLLRYKISSRRRGRSIAVLVSAPVRYSAKDFLLLLYGEICSAVLSNADRTSAATQRFQKMAHSFLGVACVVLLWLTIVNVSVYQPSLQSHEDVARFSQFVQTNGLIWTAPPILCFLLLTVAFLVRRRLKSARVSKRFRATPLDRKLMEDARRNLARIRYLRTEGFSSGGQATFLGLQLTGTRSGQRVEQTATLPEVTASYHAFMADVLDWSHSHDRNAPLVCIDEADRIGKPAELAEFLSDVKSVISVPGVVYAVSIAEDAMGSTGMDGTLPALTNATFDDVIKMTPMRLYESMSMLTSQVVGMSDRTVALCHLLGNGLPRDVVRQVRILLNESRSTGEREIQNLVRSLVSQRITDQFMSMNDVLAARTPSGHRHRLPPDIEWGRVDALWCQASSTVATSQTPSLAKVLGCGMSQELASILFLQTVKDAFSHADTYIEQDTEQARDQLSDVEGWGLGRALGQPILTVEVLASCVFERADDALRSILSVRDAWGLASGTAAQVPRVDQP
jgi:hypothetical protein